MTNEQKAEEIAKEYSRPYGFGLNNDSSIECYQSALQAMEWKEQQFIDKAVEYIKIHTLKTMSSRDIHNIIVDFKEAMKGE